MSPARRPRRRRATSADAAHDSPFARSAASDPGARALFSPHSLDAQRYAAFRAGLAPAEIAARENVRVSTVEKSIEKLKTAAQLYSQEAVEISVRRSVLDAAPTMHNSLIAMLTATREQIRHIDGDPNRTEYIEVADHKTRALAIAQLTDLIESIREQAPLVSVSQQNNTQNNLSLGPGGLSTESMIRQIREERGLALPADTILADPDAAILPDTIDFELQKELAEEAKLAAEEALVVGELEEAPEDD